MNEPSKNEYEQLKGYEFWVKIAPDVKVVLSQNEIKLAI